MGARVVGSKTVRFPVSGEVSMMGPAGAAAAGAGRRPRRTRRHKKKNPGRKYQCNVSDLDDPGMAPGAEDGKRANKGPYIARMATVNVCLDHLVVSLGGMNGKSKRKP
jgi:hypothetical protein